MHSICSELYKNEHPNVVGLYTYSEDTTPEGAARESFLFLPFLPFNNHSFVTSRIICPSFTLPELHSYLSAAPQKNSRSRVSGRTGKSAAQPGNTAMRKSSWPLGYLGKECSDTF